MKLALIFITAFLFVGCTTLGSYKEIENGKFLISVNSNALSSPGRINSKIKEKAKEACKGGEWYLVESLGSQVHNIKTYDKYNTSANVLTTQKIIGCGKLVKYYEHPSHGIVELPDYRFVSDQGACEYYKYNNEVLIDGEKVTDTSKIKKYEAAFYLWAVKNLKKVQLKDAEKYAPEQFKEAVRIREEYRECMDKKGWGNQKQRIIKS